jgi:hypothetical protein
LWPKKKAPAEQQTLGSRKVTDEEGMTDGIDDSTGFELSAEEKELLGRIEKRTPAENALAALIIEVSNCLRSAENALEKRLPKRLAQETERLTRMLKGWHELDGRSEELDARMHFTEGVVFFAGTGEDPNQAARKLLARVSALAPKYAGAMSLEGTAKAIAAWRATKKFSWPDMGQAWDPERVGGKAIDANSWGVAWNRHYSGLRSD